MFSAITSRWWDRSTLWETAFFALGAVFALQLLRVFLTGLVFYLRDSQGAGSIAPGIYALVLFMVAFLAVPVGRALGARGALVLTSGGVASARIVEQLVPWPVVDLAVTTVGIACFLMFVPTYVGHLRGRGGGASQPFAMGLLLGIGIDTALKGVFGTLDLSWQPGVVAHMIVVLMFMLQWPLLVLVLRATETGQPGFAKRLNALPLMALGPVIFLALLLFQNIGQQTALIGWDQAHVFAWVVLANAVGVVAAIGVVARPAYGGAVTLSALGGLFVLLVLGERSGLAAALVALYGQAVLAMSVGVIGLAVGSGAGGPSIGRASVASGVGMLVLLVLAFLYYANYAFDIPGGTSVIAPIGLVVIFLSVAAGIRGLRAHRIGAVSMAPAVVAILLLLAPVGYLAAWDEPRPESPSGLPVRVMSYNLHQGFDVDGSLAIEELAREIERQEPDIVALQEVSRGWVIDGSFDMLVWLSRRLDMPHSWGPAADSVWGNAILSRYPILNARTEPMPNNHQLQLKRSLIAAEIDIGESQPLLVIATHLHHVEEEGYRRLPQVRAVLGAWRKRTASVIMGDFNALPDDPEMNLLREAEVKDAYLMFPPQPPGRGESSDGTPDASRATGYTAPSKDPAKRIDYIWVSDDLKVSNFSLTHSTASDHFGLAVTIEPSPRPSATPLPQGEGPGVRVRGSNFIHGGAGGNQLDGF